MREVAILGIGQTSVEEHWDKSLRELATQAVVNAMWDAQRDRVDGIFIGNMMSGMVSRQENLGAQVADWSGLRGVEAFKVEAACGSGAAAVHLGVMAIASGYMDAVIAMGVEKMTDADIDLPCPFFMTRSVPDSWDSPRFGKLFLSFDSFPFSSCFSQPPVTHTVGLQLIVKFEFYYLDQIECRF